MDHGKICMALLDRVAELNRSMPEYYWFATIKPNRLGSKPLYAIGFMTPDRRVCREAAFNVSEDTAYRGYELMPLDESVRALVHSIAMDRKTEMSPNYGI